MRVLFIFSILAAFIGGEASSTAAWWDCFCLASKRDCANKIMPPRTHQRAMPNLKAARIGAHAELQLGKTTVSGVIIDATFEGIVLAQMHKGKRVRKVIEHRKIDSMKLTEAEGPLESYGVKPVRAKVLVERLEARRKYLDFINTDFITPIKEAVVSEVQKLRALKDNAEREAYIRAEAAKVVALVEEKFAIDNIGFHYNLNGGVGSDYVGGGGLIYSRGDVALAYGLHGDLAEKIYIFQSKHASVYDVLHTTNPKVVFGGRMGSELNVFSLDNPYIRQAKQEGGIPNSSEISLDFNPDWLSKQDFNQVGSGRIGIPYSTYLAPPIQVFMGVSKYFPELKKLSRQDETLITLRQLEAILMSEKSFLP